MHTTLLVLLALAGVAFVSADSPKRYQLGEVEADSVPELCKNGNPKSCRQVESSYIQLKGDH